MRVATRYDKPRTRPPHSLARDLHPLLRQDSTTEFVQAISLSLDIVGCKGGRCRPQRSPLSPKIAAQVTKATHNAVAAGYN